MNKYIPSQKRGKQVDLNARVVLTGESEAVDFFKLAKHNLFNINRWYALATLPAATFTLTDGAGNETRKERAMEGDFVRIDIPGPGPSSGDGYDWVRVEKMVDEVSDNGPICAITLRPAVNPSDPAAGPAHFFEDSASSTLIVRQEGKEVIASYHGRNEVVNTAMDSQIDNLRNAVVGWSAKMGLSYPQWESLIQGLTKKKQIDS